MLEQWYIDMYLRHVYHAQFMPTLSNFFANSQIFLPNGENKIYFLPLLSSPPIRAVELLLLLFVIIIIMQFCWVGLDGEDKNCCNSAVASVPALSC